MVMLFQLYNEILSIGIFRKSRKFFWKYFGSTILILLKKHIPTPKSSHHFKTIFSATEESTKRTFDFDAHNIIEGNYAFLGISIKSKPLPNWHKDYVSGFVWPLAPYNKVRLHTPEGSDVKYPWELSTFFHLFPVALAYKETKDQKLLNFYLSQLNDWMNSNPCFYGINWANPMSVSLRLIILIETTSLFSKDIPIQARIRIQRCIWHHFLFLICNLENLGRCPANHYLTDIVGILWGSLHFSKNNSLIRLIRNWAVATIEQEVESQVLPDGMHFEGSTSYHRLVTELFLYSAILLRKNGIAVSAFYKERLKLMLRALNLFTLPTTLYPHIGDNDDCRLFYGSDYYSWNKRDASYILAIGAVFFNDSNFFPKQQNSNELASLIFGQDEVNRLEQKPTDSYPNRFTLDSSQFYFIGNDEDCLTINCSCPRHPEYGHTHNDSLSFVLCLKGREVFVDPGSYFYTRDKKMRNLFRSTKYHNVLEIDKKDQWPLPENALFFIPKGAPPKVLRWHSTEKKDVFTGEHYGYTRMPGKIVHKRTFSVEKETFTISLKDDLYYQREPQGNNAALQVCSRFQLAPDLQANVEEGAVFIHEINKSSPSFIIFFKQIDNLSVSLENAWFSPSYGKKLPSTVIVFKNFSFIPFSFEYKIEKYNPFTY